MFDERVIETLNEPLATESIKHRKGGGGTFSYLASHHVINEANRVFGFGAWETEIQILKQVDRTEYEKPPFKSGESPKQMISFSYLCQLKLTVKSEGSVNSYEDTGFGNGVAAMTANGIASSIELASKEAVTDALKRCFRYYGNKFGNSLYNTESNGALSEGEINLSKKIDEDHLKILDGLISERGVDREWLLVAMRADGYGYQSIEDMPMGWFQKASTLAHEYKIDEINKGKYKSEMDKRIKLINESVSINMLRAVHIEAVTLAREQDDKEMLIKLEDIKNKNKLRLEDS